MCLLRFGLLIRQLRQISHVPRHVLGPCIGPGSCAAVSIPKRSSSIISDKKLPEDLPVDVDPGNKPVQYTTSGAFSVKVLDLTAEDMRSKIQRRVVAVSIAVFLLYFCVLREENDLDMQMITPLWERVPGLEKQTLIALIEFNKKAGKDNALAEARLAEIIEEEKRSKFKMPI